MALPSKWLIVNFDRGVISAQKYTMLPFVHYQSWLKSRLAIEQSAQSMIELLLHGNRALTAEDNWLLRWSLVD